MSRAIERRIPLPFSIAILALAVVGVFYNGLDNGFVWDDQVQIVDNPWIKDVAYLDDLFSADVFRHYQTVETTNYYRPVAHVVYMATWQLFGSSARAFHAVNLLLHLAVTVMVLLIAQRLLAAPSVPGEEGRRGEGASGQRDAPMGWAALLAALLFAVHPIHTEAVDWISGIMEPLYTLFGLLSFYFFLDLVQRRSRASLLLSALLFLLALFSKETAVLLLPLFFFWDLSQAKELSIRKIRYGDYLPYVLVVAFYLAMRTHALDRFIPLDMHPDLTTYDCVINIFPLFVQHLWKLVWPVDLNVFHVFRPVRSILEPRALLGLIVSVGYLVSLYWWWKRDRLVCFSLLLILLPLLPFFYIRGIAPVLFAEQHLYLPSLGFVLLLARLALWVDSGDRNLRYGLWVSCLVVICLFYVATVRRNPVWKDNLTLWSDAVSKSPDSGFVHESLAGALLARGRIDEAIQHYELTLKNDPSPSARVYNNIGIAYSERGWTDRAIEAFTRSLQIRPDYARAHLGLGIAFYQKGWTEKAIDELRLAIIYDPYLADAHHNLGVAYIKLGNRSEAEKAMGQASKLDPEYYKRPR